MAEKNYLQWLTNDTQTIWWHDSADKREMETAVQNGATGMTTNPFLMASTLYASREEWKDVVGDISKLSGDDKALELERKIGAYYANRFSDVWAKGNLGEGGVCAQVSPCKIGDKKLMIEQIKKIAQFAPNIFIKIPATKAGIEVFEEGIALGYNMVATVGFTVPQVLAVAQAQIRGEDRAKANGIKAGIGVAVNMIGRLDDYLRDVVSDNGLNIPESDIIQAGIACIKKSYNIFEQKGYNTILMPAAGRGIYHVTELAGAKIVMSVAPKIQQLLLEANPEQMEKINVPVDQKVIDRLMTMPEFAKAYNEDGMTPDEFITYGPVNRTATQFVESGWNLLIKY